MVRSFLEPAEAAAKLPSKLLKHLHHDTEFLVIGLSGLVRSQRARAGKEKRTQDRVEKGVAWQYPNITLETYAI